MDFGKHVKRKALYCCSVSVVGLLIACLIGFAMGVGLVDVHLEEEAHAAVSSGTSSETSSTSGALKKNSAPQSQTQAVSSPTQVALDGISAVEGSATITTQGFTLSADSQAAVQSQIATFEADGYTASFVLADITTGRTIAYNADAQIYSASSAKAPYLISLFSTGTVDLNSVAQSADAQSATVHQKVDAVLRNSDNASYDWLYKTYGLDCFNTWAEQAGAASRMGDRGGYLFTSARDMAKLWTAGYGFLFAGQTAGGAEHHARIAAMAVRRHDEFAELLHPRGPWRCGHRVHEGRMDQRRRRFVRAERCRTGDVAVGHVRAGGADERVRPQRFADQPDRHARRSAFGGYAGVIRFKLG